ncbi:site-specific integrase, partial [Candidatus Bathyarchaeota archaeon]|nr:site-specific integrase [Candidatus Bathyarchaeota archaeon]
MENEALKCPQCGGARLFRDGLRRLADGSAVQRWLCRDCMYRFSEKPVEENISKVLRSELDLSLNRRVCAGEDPAKNSAQGVVALKEKADAESRAAGATADLKSVESDLVNFAWHLKKKGLKESTIQTYEKALRSLLAAGADLRDPESVKEALARISKGTHWKALVIATYTAFLKMLGKTWEPPSCEVTRKLPFIPTEEEIDALIASCGRKTATLLQMLKETGMRVGEALRLRWADVDLERRFLILNDPEKGGNPRIFKISEKLAGMLGSLPREGERIFAISVSSANSTFFISRRRAAEKLQNPRLKRIGFHTIRHWRATMEYHKTKDILHVKQLLGHKRIENTMLYIQLEEALFSKPSEEFHFAAARSVDEAGRLIEVGFEYVCTYDNVM